MKKESKKVIRRKLQVYQDCLEACERRKKRNIKSLFVRTLIDEDIEFFKKKLKGLREGK